MSNMKAIVISAFGPAKLSSTSVHSASTTPKCTCVGEWAESVPISGIECVGTVEDCPGGEFTVGTPVAAFMGGLGRTTPGSYAQYTVADVGNVVALGDPGEELPISWADAAALPESYATAWTCLFRNLKVERGHKLLIRGATSAFGRAALNLAVEAGAIVTATTRSESKFAQLKELGVSDVVTEGPNLSDRLREQGKTEKFDRILELVGNSTVVESLQLVRRDGYLCLAGWLGGLDPIKGPGPLPGFNPLLQMASGVNFNFFGSFVFGTPDFLVSDVPLRKIVHMVADGKFDAKPWKVFKFEEIREAHRAMENHETNGKMVVVVD
ncbi:putative zinc-type alcohol dehydrogenase-like protein YogA [Cladobotryum mycophilum]|uniref:Zinc-type alcohol dehydrogenase-like protein YogA n=1 Tax=Cladobotryum mycophilum TaxID=491253 RepID=A0ABR0SAP8_9HYPO